MILRVYIGILWLTATLIQAANPSYSEVRDLLRKHLDGVTDEALDAAATEGLLRRYAGQAMLVTNGISRTELDDTNSAVIAGATVFDNYYGYVRLGRLTQEADISLRQSVTSLNTSNKIKGLVVDLRFATGRDLSAAAGVAGLLVGQSKPLMEWKGQQFTAPAERGVASVPLVVLVNRQTRGAPEVLAAILREHQLAAIIGSPTRGETAEYQDFKLSSGQTLRLATAAVRLGAGKPLPHGGVQPDIPVLVNERDERGFLQNPYYLTADAAMETNARPRLTEADLVRMKREESNPDAAAKSRPATRWPPPKPLVYDPVLARGLDLLKGLNLLKVNPGS